MKLTTTLIVLGVAGIVAIGGYAKINGYRGQVIVAETNLSAAYQNNQNQLSSYVLGFGEQTGIADRQAQQLRTILTDAVKGRYDGKMSSAQVGQGTLFSAISEAYPQIDTKSYDKIVTYIQANRESFRLKQESLLGNIRQYEVLVNGDIINSMLANILGVPTKNLQARIGKNVVYGEAALAQIKTIVIDDTTGAAFDSGTMKPLTAPPLQDQNSTQK